MTTKATANDKPKPRAKDLRTHHDELVEDWLLERRLSQILMQGADGGVTVTRAQDINGRWVYRMRWKYRTADQNVAMQKFWRGVRW